MANEKKQLVFKTGHSKLTFGPVNDHGKLVVKNAFGNIECVYYFSAADILFLNSFLLAQLEVQPQPMQAGFKVLNQVPETCFEACGKCDRKGCKKETKTRTGNGVTDTNE